MPGRVGAAIMSRIEMQTFVADSAEDFVNRGVFWAANPAKLSALRASLREHVSTSPLRKPEVITAGLARAFRIMWQRWCAGLPAESLEVTLNDLKNIKQEAIQ
jgi:predicted O-linked N-acetylglucosamine transferase (SPINDLY family)